MINMKYDPNFVNFSKIEKFRRLEKFLPASHRGLNQNFSKNTNFRLLDICLQQNLTVSRMRLVDCAFERSRCHLSNAQSIACNRRLVVSIFWPKVAGIVEISALKTKNWLFSTFFHRGLPHQNYFLTKKDTTAVGCALERWHPGLSNAQSIKVTSCLVEKLMGSG